jgi:ATP-dependent Lon protease
MENQTTCRYIPMLPLRGVLVFPYTVIHLDVGRKKSISAIEEAMMDTKEIFLATQKEAQTDEPEIEDIYTAGTVAEIKQILKMPGGTMRVLVEGLHRAKITRFISSEPYMQVEIEEYKEDNEPKTPET